jgi:plastocyanin
MRKALLPLVLLLALAFAGCSGKDKEADVQPVTCPDGTVLSAEQIEAIPDHHEAGFNATAHCPVKPSVTLAGIPRSLGAFRTAAFSWTLDNGTVEHAHSMLTSIRYADRSVPDQDLTNVNKYPSELIKREHQNLPVTYQGNLTFGKVGKVYLRAYMEVAGADYWSPEYALDVKPVVPTGKVIQFTHPMGEGAQDIQPTASPAVLGDAIQVVNQDAVAHKCSFSSGPAATAALEAQGQADSNTVVLEAPGVYEFKCDGVVAQKTFSVNVKVE